jgi:hypothetical protein
MDEETILKYYVGACGTVLLPRDQRVFHYYNDNKSALNSDYNKFATEYYDQYLTPKIDREEIARIIEEIHSTPDNYFHHFSFGETQKMFEFCEKLENAIPKSLPKSAIVQFELALDGNGKDVFQLNIEPIECQTLKNARYFYYKCYTLFNVENDFKKDVYRQWKNIRSSDNRKNLLDGYIKSRNNEGSFNSLAVTHVSIVLFLYQSFVEKVMNRIIKETGKSDEKYKFFKKIIDLVPNCPKKKNNKGDWIFDADQPSIINTIKWELLEEYVRKRNYITHKIKSEDLNNTLKITISEIEKIRDIFEQLAICLWESNFGVFPGYIQELGCKRNDFTSEIAMIKTESKLLFNDTLKE